MQYHKQRSEFWRILSGKGKITLGDEIIEAKKNDEFFIPIGIKHTAEGGDEELVFLEISFGNYDESDIVRLEDKYGRKN